MTAVRLFSACLNEAIGSTVEEAWLSVLLKMSKVRRAPVKVGAAVLLSQVSPYALALAPAPPSLQTHSCMERLQYSMWRGVPFLLNCTTV